MARPDDFSTAALDAVADKVGRRLARVLGGRLLPATAVTITSTLQVWALTADRLARDPAVDLAGLAEPTARWQHQIDLDGEPDLYARSTPPAPGADPGVHEIVVSPVVARLDAAIDLADRDGTADEVARLREAAEYHVWALWLVDPQGRGRVVVVDAPPGTAPEPGRFHPDAELVAALRRVRPVVGVRAN